MFLKLVLQQSARIEINYLFGSLSTEDIAIPKRMCYFLLYISIKHLTCKKKQGEWNRLETLNRSFKIFFKIRWKIIYRIDLIAVSHKIKDSICCEVSKKIVHFIKPKS